MNDLKLNHFALGRLSFGNTVDSHSFSCRVSIDSNVLYLALDDVDIRSNPALLVDEFVRLLFEDARAAGILLNVRHFDRSVAPTLPGALTVARFGRYASVTDLDFRSMLAELVSTIQSRGNGVAVPEQINQELLLLLVGADSFGNEPSDTKLLRDHVQQGLSGFARDAGVLIVAYGRTPNATLRALEDSKLCDGFQSVALHWRNGWVLKDRHLPGFARDLGYVHQADVSETSDQARAAWQPLTLALEEAECVGEHNFLSISVGHVQSGGPFRFKLGKSAECYHAMIVGTSGSGKSTLLNILILGIAENYGSDEVELYLADLKQGVEFQHFAEHPNCRAIFLGANRLDDMLHLMHEFVGEVDKRGVLFRSAGVSNITEYNELEPESRLAAIILVIDEVHELFAGGWKQNSEFEALLLRVLRQGRSMGIHLILSTQTIKGANISSSLLTEIQLRIAFRLAASEVFGIFSDVRNDAAARLAKFQFIYNAKFGNAAANVVVNALPPRNIRAAIAEVNVSRSAEQRLVPRIITGTAEQQSTDHAQLPEPEIPRPARTAWASNRLEEL